MAQRGAAPGGGQPAVPMLHPRRLRLRLTAAIMVTAGVAVAASVGLPGDDDTYIATHGVVALPFLASALVLTGHALREGPAAYRPFWIRWRWACAAGAGAAAAGAAAGIGHIRALRVVDVALLLAAWPLILAAGRRLAAAQSGRRDLSVDALDTAMALVVLGAPGALLALPAILDADEPVFAVPLALVALVTPAALYGSILGVSRLPRGERVTQGIGLALCAAMTINATLQVARALGTLDWPVPVFVTAHASNMAAIPLVALWAHREVTPGLGRLPLEHQARTAHPMPYVAAVVLPLLAGLVYLTGDDRSWGTGILAAVLLVTIALNAVRYTLVSRENRRLTGEVAELAAERRRLLSDLVRALEDDRRQSVTELHAQTVGSLATLVSIAQSSYVSLPPDAAAAVKDAIGGLRTDLDERAEGLRRLLVALRPPPDIATDGTPGDGGAALGGTDHRGHGRDRTEHSGAEHRGPDQADADRGEHDRGHDDGKGGADRATTGGAVDSPGRDGAHPLAAALLAYGADLADDCDSLGPRVGVQVDPGLVLDRAMTTIAYRIAQEALRNAARHAGSRSATVDVRAERDAVVVEISDDGIGFDPATIRERSGIATMRMFAGLAGGDLAITASPGRGTTVRATLRSPTASPPRARADAPGLRIVPEPPPVP